MEKYPVYDKLKKKNLEKPKPSPRYGDFNVETHRKHYLDGHCYPHRDVQTGGNLTRNRTDQMPGSSRAADQNDNVEEAISYEVTEEIDFKYNLHSKPIRQPKHEIHFDGSKFYKRLNTELGTLYLNRKGIEDKKWRKGQGGTPVLRRNFTKYPPILIPSRGRSRTALLNLSDAMKREKYYEIVVIGTEDRDDYLKMLCQQKEIDVFVMKECPPGGKQTAGRARYYCKKLAELITQGTGIRFYLAMDDNVCSWQGITLVNDPNPLFDSPPTHKESQVEDICLHTVLNHFSLSMLNRNMSEFSIIGFLTNDRYSKQRLVNAYGRRHVFQAVIQNLGKLKDVDYRQQLWCMEDIFFNDDTNKENGVIVKCQRFLVKKKSLKDGGVVPENMPQDVENRMKKNKNWMEINQGNTSRMRPMTISQVELSDDLKFIQRYEAQEQEKQRRMRIAARKSEYFVPEIIRAKKDFPTFYQKVKDICIEVIMDGKGSGEEKELAEEIQKIISDRDGGFIEMEKATQIYCHEFFATEVNILEVHDDSDTSRQGAKITTTRVTEGDCIWTNFKGLKRGHNQMDQRSTEDNQRKMLRSPSTSSVPSLMSISPSASSVTSQMLRSPSSSPSLRSRSPSASSVTSQMSRPPSPSSVPSLRSRSPSPSSVPTQMSRGYKDFQRRKDFCMTGTKYDDDGDVDEDNNDDDEYFDDDEEEDVDDDDDEEEDVDDDEEDVDDDDEEEDVDDDEEDL